MSARTSIGVELYKASEALRLLAIAYRTNGDLESAAACHACGERVTDLIIAEAKKQRAGMVCS